jgi:RNA methyltransferase, TrmH family
MEISSVHNPRVKEWAQLSERKHRDKQSLFVVEGTHLVQEALRHGAKIQVIAYSIERGIPEELREWYDEGEVAEAAPGNATPKSRVEWIGVSEAVLAKCTDTQTPQPVFAVVGKSEHGIDALLRLEGSLVVVVDGVQDPGNLGTIIRSADAVGADGVLLGRGTVDLYNPKTVRSTMGSLFHLPIIEVELPELLSQASERGIQVLGTSLQASSTCYEADLRPATWIIVGNEGRGVSPEVSNIVTRNVIIPIPGHAESLNVAMATTVLLYEALRQRRFTT